MYPKPKNSNLKPVTNGYTRQLATITDSYKKRKN